MQGMRICFHLRGSNIHVGGLFWSWELTNVEMGVCPWKLTNLNNGGLFWPWRFEHALLHIVPLCEGPNKKSEGFAKEKQKT